MFLALLVRHSQAGTKYLVKTKGEVDVGEGSKVRSTSVSYDGRMSMDATPKFEKPKKGKTKKEKNKRQFKSGCPQHSLEEENQNKAQGRCRNRKTCSWADPGETMYWEGCTAEICQEDGSGWSVTVDNACNKCITPGSLKNWWHTYYRVGDEYHCGENNCDLCTCQRDGSRTKVEVEKDRCKRCVDPNNKEVLTEHKVGDSWQCWVNKWSCKADCTCKPSRPGYYPWTSYRPAVGCKFCKDMNDVMTEQRVGDTWQCWYNNWSCYGNCTCSLSSGGWTNTRFRGGFGCWSG